MPKVLMLGRMSPRWRFPDAWTTVLKLLSTQPVALATLLAEPSESILAELAFA